MPSMRHHDPGNMYIQFEIEYPQGPLIFNAEERKQLRKMLNVPEDEEKVQLRLRRAIEDARANKKSADSMDVDFKIDTTTNKIIDNGQGDEIDAFASPVPKDDVVEKIGLEDVDPKGQRGTNGVTMEDEEDEGMPAGAERMQCASQ